MECMNVFFVHVVQHHVQVIGGMLINILDQLFSCKPISMFCRDLGVLTDPICMSLRIGIDLFEDGEIHKNCQIGRKKTLSWDHGVLARNEGLS